MGMQALREPSDILSGPISHASLGIMWREAQSCSDCPPASGSGGCRRGIFRGKRTQLCRPVGSAISRLAYGFGCPYPTPLHAIRAFSNAVMQRPLHGLSSGSE